MDEIRLVAVNGLMHGNGFPTSSLDRALEADPHAIGVDAGSTDAGPTYLGSGDTMHERGDAKAVLRDLITRARRADIPLLIGSAGSAGADGQVDWTYDIVTEVLREETLSASVARIYAEQSADAIRRLQADDRTKPLDRSEPLDAETIEETDRIVAMMGPEGFREALDRGADIVVSGRCSDTAIFQGVCLDEDVPEGLALHLAKVIECGGQVAIPRTGGDCVLGTLSESEFTVRPTNPEKTTDTITIASHMLYETDNPYSFVEPRGTLDTTECRYEQVDADTVAVTGSQFEPADQYTVRLEGVRQVGYRAITLVGIRDPTLVEGFEDFEKTVRASIREKARDHGLEDDDIVVSFNAYGKDGVMGDIEPETTRSHELGVLIDIVAPTEETADSLLAHARYKMLHTDFPGRMCTSGNAAFPVAPTDISAGEVYEFTVWHAAAIDDPMALFDIEMTDIRAGVEA
ncbi:MAG: acyclic terpene utilization AtuA family protein [Halapricum sp.]